jgi:uncharacterized membrane protein YjjP (DUF1212 family)
MSSSYDKLDSEPASGAITPNRKGKKRVGWHTAGNSEGGESGSGSGNGGAATAPVRMVTDFDGSHSPMESLPSHSRGGSGSVPFGAPDPRELTTALSRIITDEQKERERAEDAAREEREQSTASASVEPRHLRVPSVPRPALRQNTSYDAPQERETADMAELQASERQQRSINDARTRAFQLADSLGGRFAAAGHRSAPTSRRNSRELADAFQPMAGDSDYRNPDDSHDTAAEGGPSALNPSQDDEPADGHYLRRRTRTSIHPQVETPPNETTEMPDDDHDLAANLVRTYTRSGRDELFAHAGTESSGTNTPNQLPGDGEYVPRPNKYRGGVLASLLKLQRESKRWGGSGLTTPSASAPVSPAASPGPSPPSSRPASIIGMPRARPTSSLFNLRRSNRSTSSMALSELMKSSSTFAATASGGISDHVAEKLKKHHAPPKSKKEQIRITVHIAGIISRHRYLLKLCRALMMYGAPTHRLEEYMAMSARVLEIEGQFLYIPGCMIISFDDSTTHTTEVKLVRVPQGIDLGRLRDVHNIYKEVVHDKLGVEEATQRLDQVMKGKPKFSKVFRVFMYGIASACVAPFAFEGRWIDLPIAFLLGSLVGILQLVLAPSNELYANVFEVTASVITSFIARGFGSIHNGELFCFSALAQSSIALILPGYLVLCSSLELQSHNIVAGSVRMVYAMIYTLFLGYGITIGASLYGMLDSNAASQTHCSNPLNRDWYLLFVPAFTMCLCIINQAQWKQTPVMLVMALAGYCVNSYTTKYFASNTQISNMLGALAIGILANLYSRVGRHCWNTWLDVVDYWNFKIRPRIMRKKKSRRGSNTWPMEALSDDPESVTSEDEKPKRQTRQVGYSLAAAAMLPAIFVQVPSGLAAGGSLLAGITSANQITGNSTTKIDTSADTIGNMNGTAFNVLFSVIQVAICISVGLFMSALIVYPLGKRRSGLFSF